MAGVNVGGVIIGQETVALDAASSHHDEDTKSGVRDRKTLRRGLGQRSRQKVDALDIAVDRLQFLLPGLVFSEFLEIRRHAHPQHAPERAIAGHAAFAVANDVGRRQVGHDALGDVFGQPPQMGWIIVQHGRARETSAERVQHIFERHLAVHLCGAASQEAGKRAGQHLLVVAAPAEREIVRKQRMQTIDRRELLGDRIGGRKLIGRRGRNAGQQFVVRRPAQGPEEGLAQYAPPARAHRVVQRWRLQQCKRPFGGVDLGDQRGVD